MQTQAVTACDCYYLASHVNNACQGEVDNLESSTTLQCPLSAIDNTFETGDINLMVMYRNSHGKGNIFLVNHFIIASHNLNLSIKPARYPNYSAQTVIYQWKLIYKSRHRSICKVLELFFLGMMYGDVLDQWNILCRHANTETYWNREKNCSSDIIFGL